MYTEKWKTYFGMFWEHSFEVCIQWDEVHYSLFKHGSKWITPYNMDEEVFVTNWGTCHVQRFQLVLYNNYVFLLYICISAILQSYLRLETIEKQRAYSLDVQWTFLLNLTLQIFTLQSWFECSRVIHVTKYFNNFQSQNLKVNALHCDSSVLQKLYTW